VKRALAIVGAVAIVGGAAVWALAPSGGDDEPDAQAWDRKAQAAFAELVREVPDLVVGAREWLAGGRAPDRTRERVTHLATPRPFAAVHDLYERSAQLYVEVARVYRVAVASPASELRSQLDLLARRVRELGDRVFDRGRALLSLDDPAPGGLVQVHRPEEVPIWPDEGLAAGPPLEDPPPPPAGLPPLRRETRPEEAPAEWRHAVRTAGVPAVSALALAIGGRDGGQLRQLSRQLVAAAERLRDQPDPRGDREKGARVRLSLLVSADAARTAQAAALLADPVLADRLDRVARRLALVGDGLWASELGARQTGFDLRLLEEQGP